MSLFQSLLGTMETLFHFGGPAKSCIKDVSGVLVARDDADANDVRMRTASFANDDTCVATGKDTKERLIPVGLSFPSAGPFPATAGYAMAEDTGGIYTEGQVYLAPGGAGAPTALPTPRYVGLTITTSIAIALVASGQNLIANGVYTIDAVVAPQIWVLKGDGSGASAAGLSRTIEYNITDVPGNQDSVTSIPAGARITSTVLIVTAAYGGTNTLQVSQGATVLMPTTGNSPTSAKTYEDRNHQLTAGLAAVRVVVAGPPASGGTATCIVTYVAAPQP